MVYRWILTVKRELFGDSEDGATDIQQDGNADNGLFDWSYTSRTGLTRD